MKLPFDFAIREATPEDAESVTAIIRACWTDDTPDVARIASLIGAPGRATLCAWDGAACVGFVDCFATTDRNGQPRWEIDLLAVLPAARGRRVSASLIARAWEAGSVRLAFGIARALVREGNTAAERSFSAAGFRPDGPALGLFVALPDATVAAGLQTASVPVETLTYRGLWLEGAPGLSDLRAARGEAAARRGDRVGTLQSIEYEALCELAGYSLAGPFRWWSRPL